ncbi:type VII toxin-antitoxin system MntA family adenylyltransferase antitoxin [Pelotomaculum schinkii]|nr:nucleotidyltransferase domain-containing protein [Pelotomaculum schinkii]
MHQHRIFSLLAEYFSKNNEVMAAYVFGSYAEDVARPDSDIDIAVIMEPVSRDTMEYRLAVMEDIKRLTGLDADIIVLNEAPIMLQFQVIQKGKVVFERDADKRAVFVMSVAGRYYDYKRYFDYHARHLAERIKEVGLGVR